MECHDTMKGRLLETSMTLSLQWSLPTDSSSYVVQIVAAGRCVIGARNG
jgi:hypothetical protein